MKNKQVNAIAGIGLIVVVAVVAAILIMTNMPKTPVATVTDTPTVSSEPTTIPTTTAQGSQWKSYSNPKYNISFEYPATTTVSVANPNTVREFLNITGKDNPGFWVTVAALSSAPFFNPPANTDVTQWILNNKKYPQTYDKIGASRTIAGVKAVHLFLQGKTSPTSDTYYIIRNGRLYQITLLDDSANHDLTEKNHFLDSIKIN